MRRLLRASLVVALIPLIVAVAEIFRSQGTSFVNSAILASLSLGALFALIPLQKSEKANHLTEKMEIIMMWIVVILFVIAIALRWGNVL